MGFSIGTETLGSIVAPSARCGVAGLRPTFGRVSRSGAMALSWSMDKIGPICRSVADCAEVLRIIAGRDGKDLTVIEAPFNWDARRPLKKLKVGYPAAEFERLPEKTKPVFDAALAALRRTGVDLLPMQLPDFPIQAVDILLNAEAAAAFDDLTREADLGATEHKLDALWAAISRARDTGDFRPRPSKLCDWRRHKALCLEFGGTLPPLR